jgi:hypothetical protein
VLQPRRSDCLVNKQRDRAGRREQLTQKLQTLWPENTDQDGHPGEVTARSAEAVNEACLDWIGTGHEYNRDGFGCKPNTFPRKLGPVQV